MPVTQQGNPRTPGTPVSQATSSLSTHLPWILDHLAYGDGWRLYDPEDYPFQDATLRWIHDSGLFGVEETETLQAYSMTVLANLWCQGEEGVTDLVVRLMAWISALDDKIVEVRRPLSDYLTACGQVLRTGKLPADADLYLRAGLDLRDHLIDVGAAAVLPELADSIDTFLSAAKREERWRATGALPDVASYLANRQAGISVMPFMVLARLMDGVSPPQAPISTSLDQLRWLVCRLTGIENDLLSAHKEELEGTVRTFLAVLENAYGTDTRGSLACGLAIVAALRDQQDQLLAAILNDPDESPHSRRYAELVGTWAAGSAAFHLSAPRFALADFIDQLPGKSRTT